MWGTNFLRKEEEYVLFVLSVKENGEESWLEARTTDNSDFFAKEAMKGNMFIHYIEWEKMGAIFRLVRNKNYRMEGYN